MDIDIALTWIAVFVAFIGAFIMGVWIGHRRYMAGYIDGYLDAMDDRNEIDNGNPDYV